jgi:uncharacterized protein (TIGR02246 family)
MRDVSEPAQVAIRALHDRWMSLELAGQPAGVLELCTEDVVWLPPGGPALHGQTMVRQWLAGFPATVLQRIETTSLRIEAQDGLAWKLASFETWFVGPGLTGPNRVRGTHLWVLRKIESGVWRVAAVAWSVSDPMQPA